MRSTRGSWAPIICGLACAAVVACGAYLGARWVGRDASTFSQTTDGGRSPHGGGPGGDSAARTLLSIAEAESLRPRVVEFCGGCHAPPDPGTFPRRAWLEEVEQGYRFHYQSRRAIAVPALADVVAFYQSLAPETLDVPALEDGPVPPVGFERQAIPLPAGATFPAVSSLGWHASEGALYVTDMGIGQIGRIAFDGRNPRAQALARLSYPARVIPADLDGDGNQDFLAAELGSFQPGDHDKGAVVWLRTSVGATECEPVVLSEGHGRVADVQPADFDGDGDTDLVVAEFGWRKGGRILLLRRDGDSGGIPRFRREVLDERHGTIHVPTADLDGDGHVDFVALISQEYEVVEAFLNRGDGTFRTERIFDAGDPSFGSSGIQLVDLEGDGDLDVLYTNGDTLDSKYLKPYHAVRWLENTGDFPFVDHVLAHMPGVYRAVAGDLDGDGDLDVAAGASFPASQLRSAAGNSGEPTLATLLWLEQSDGKRFRQHALSTTPGEGHVALDAGDFDGDGRLDIAAGYFSKTDASDAAWLGLWWNRGPQQATARAKRPENRP